MAFAPGQRWISLAEPEMGLGTVLRLEGRSVQLVFPAPGVVRHYATHAAPLQRAEFRIGDRISGGGRSFVIEAVERQDGLLRYVGAADALLEGELDDIQNLASADERLIAGGVDRPDRFDFRAEALMRRAQARRSPAWGLLSTRIEPIAHQLRVAEVAAERRPPRVLLADEVGLGKTIEAGLILARQLASGRATRVLVLLPETLIHQWLVELLRRFNLAFAIFDEERCEAIEQAGDARNPFSDEQLVLADLTFLLANARRATQALDAGWDLLVVDEAHHLAWSPDATSAAYTLVEAFAHRVAGLILLTATPEQLGRSGHFARLRLLDPARYHDLQRYQREADTYVQLSSLVDKLQSAQALAASDRERLAPLVRGDATLESALDRVGGGDAAAAGILLDALIDRHGTGRVMFRNRRAVVGGFPRRVPQLAIEAAVALDDTQRQRLLAEFVSDVQQPPAPLALDYADDPRLVWLVDLLERHADDKFLLLCRSQAKVLALEEALRTRSGVKLARFHEALSIVQRDRNAAYFAEPGGARLLLCAEIGSEGRNFQFAHRLILWDLPLDPDLLEQRIGRLDRIGQREDIHIHHLAFDGTAQRVLARWYDEGLDAFRHSPADARELYKRFAARLTELALEHAHGAQEPDAEIDALVAETRAAHAELSHLIEHGRDRLLELANLRAAPLQKLQRAIEADDADRDGDDFVLRLFEQFAIDSEDQGQRTHLLDPAHLASDGFPGLKDGPQLVTFARRVALAREELPLLRADHPMVVGALDLLLQSEQGSAAFVVDTTLVPRSVLLECVFVLETNAPRALAAERFLAPFPLRVVVDTRMAERSDFRVAAAALQRAIERPVDLTRYRKILRQLVPPMRKRADELVQARAADQIAQALAQARHELGAERERLEALRAVNPGVRAEEIAALVQELAALETALPKSHARLDAARLVCSPDFLALR